MRWNCILHLIVLVNWKFISNFLIICFSFKQLHQKAVSCVLLGQFLLLARPLLQLVISYFMQMVLFQIINVCFLFFWILIVLWLLYLILLVFKFVEHPENNEKPLLEQKSNVKFKIMSLKVKGQMEYVPEMVRLCLYTLYFLFDYFWWNGGSTKADVVGFETTCIL